MSLSKIVALVLAVLFLGTGIGIEIGSGSLPEDVITIASLNTMLASTVEELTAEKATSKMLAAKLDQCGGANMALQYVHDKQTKMIAFFFQTLTEEAVAARRLDQEADHD